MSIYPTKSYPINKGLSEFEILKASHKFLRDDGPVDERGGEDNDTETGTSKGKKRWEEQLAEKYYDSLYREFAVCDLKHYKTGNFALRWRTESEVLSGAGESTCGNTRCKHHFNSTSSSSSILSDFVAPRRREEKKRKKEPKLTTLELPFAYIEHGEAKSALVKVVLCARCVKKLMWKRRKDKEAKEMKELGVDPAIVAMMAREGGVSEEESEEEEKFEEDGREDEMGKTERIGKGKEKERERPSSRAGMTRATREDYAGEDLRVRSKSHSGEAEQRSGEKRRRDERDRHEEAHPYERRSTRESRSRRPGSRSRSPTRRHTHHPHSRKRSREHDRRGT